MGPGNAKLTDFDEFAASCRALFARIAGLCGRSIPTLADDEVVAISSTVGEAIAGQNGISASRAPLVANSKATHHFLPDLVRAVDRAYTVEFFFKR